MWAQVQAVQVHAVPVQVPVQVPVLAPVLGPVPTQRLHLLLALMLQAALVPLLKARWERQPAH